MKFTLALASFLAAASANPLAPTRRASRAKSTYMSNLVSGAKVVRALEAEEGEYQVDISGCSLKFEKCQFVKSYDDDLADDEDSDTILATKRFVVFRLCPSYSSSCNSGHGEYIIDLETYLQSTVQYQQEQQEEMCNACQECGNQQEDEEQAQDEEQAADEEQADENQADEADGEQQQDGQRKLQNNYYNVNCNSCYDECMKIENMEDNGYIDATNFLDCQMIYDPEDDGKAALYAGPMCASQGSKIKIGVFEDQNCYVQDSSKDVDDYLVDGNGYPMKLSHALLKTVYSEESLVSCAAAVEEDQNGDNNGDANNEVQINEVCGELYEAAAKCETSHGFTSGYAGYYGYDNQLAQEAVVCDFIDSISAGSYDEAGEIVVNGASSAIGGGSVTTGGQKFALFFFIAGTIGLAVYAAMLHSKLSKGSSAGLADQGGAMA